MNLIRQYKLYRLGIPLSEKNKEIIEFIVNNFHDLKEVKAIESVDYSSSTYWFNKNNEYIFEVSINKALYVRYDGLLKVLKKTYLIENIIIEEFLKYLIKTIYKTICSEDKMYYGLNIDYKIIEDSFKSRLKK